MLNVNLNNYKYHANPIMTGGSAGEWDETGVERVAIIRLSNNDWRMWYSCAGERRSIGLATSTDGIQWQKYPENPVLKPSQDWEDQFMAPTSVLYVNGTFYLYYWSPGHANVDPTTGKFPPPKMKRIGLATSINGIHWERRGSLDGFEGAVLGPTPPAINENLEAGGSGVDAAKVFFFPEEKHHPWKMIYTAFGLHGQWNGYAESDDGIVWKKTVAPIANHSGFYTSATQNHRNSGQTIRCPIRVGSAWVGLSLQLDGRDVAPAIGFSLDRWTVLGRRFLYVNQDYERGGLQPWTVEADGDWYYIYYGTGNRSLGLIRAPKRTLFQPVVIWDKQSVDEKGVQSKVLENDQIRYDLYFSSNRDGDLESLVWDPTTQKWMKIHSRSIKADVLETMPFLPSDGKVRLRFVPHGSNAVVSAWVVPKSP